MPETCRAKNTSIKLPCYIKLAFPLFHEEDARSNNPQILPPPSVSKGQCRCSNTQTQRRGKEAGGVGPLPSLKLNKSRFSETPKTQSISVSKLNHRERFIKTPQCVHLHTIHSYDYVNECLTEYTNTILWWYYHRLRSLY